MVDLIFFFPYILDMEQHEQYDAPKIVKQYVDEIISSLHESFFFEDYHIGETFARKTFTQLLVEIYVEDPQMGEGFFWGEDEFEEILQKIITGSIMYQLKEDGVLNSYEDENTEETFFLTEKGKQEFEKIKNNSNI